MHAPVSGRPPLASIHPEVGPDDGVAWVDGWGIVGGRLGDRWVTPGVLVSYYVFLKLGCPRGRPFMTRTNVNAILLRPCAL